MDDVRIADKFRGADTAGDERCVHCVCPLLKLRELAGNPNTLTALWASCHTAPSVGYEGGVTVLTGNGLSGALCHEEFLFVGSGWLLRVRSISYEPKG